MRNRKLTIGLIVILALLTFTSIAVNAEAATGGDWVKVTSVQVISGGVCIYTGDTVPNPNGCSVANRYALSAEHPTFEAIYALILTAYSTDSEIRFWVENDSCLFDSPVVAAARINK